MKSQLSVRVAVLLLLMSSVAGTPEVRARVFLAVGTIYGAPLEDEPGLETTPLLLRSTGEQWERVPLPSAATGELRHVAFSTATEAWVVGVTRAGTKLFHSDDAAQTWEDVTSHLPDNVLAEKILDILFVDADRGWLVTKRVGGMRASVSLTVDGGETWTPSRTLGAVGVGGASALVRSQDGAALLRAGTDGPELLKVDGTQFGGRMSRVEKASGLFHIAAVAGVSDRQWVAGTEAATPEAGHDKPTIFSVSRDGTWVPQQILHSRPTKLRNIDVGTEAFGLAAGIQLTAPLRPIVFYMDESGIWKEGTLPGGLEGMRPARVLCGDGGRGWLAANVGGAKGMVLLTTEDGGATWSSVATSFEASGRIYSLAGSPE